MKHIFLIDDDSIFNQMHSGHFEKDKFAEKVSVFVDPCAAIDQLHQLSRIEPQNLPELIFLDINMPLTDGWKFLDELKTLPPSVIKTCKVIMLSSSNKPLDLERSKNYNMVYDFIAKPLTSTKLQALKQKLNLD